MWAKKRNTKKRLQMPQGSAEDESRRDEIHKIQPDKKKNRKGDLRYEFILIAKRKLKKRAKWRKEKLFYVTVLD